MVYHVLNRANARTQIFDSPADYELFEQVLEQGHERVAMRPVAYCLMPNHWHLVLWPQGDGDLSEFMRWLTVTHTQRWHASHGTAGAGHVYQGRYKSFPVQRTRPSAEARRQGMLEGGDAVLSVLRYVERNPLRAKLARRAEAWAYSSLHVRAGGTLGGDIPLTDPPGGLPAGWANWVNQPQTQKEIDAICRSMERGCPFGRDDWVRRVVGQWGLESTIRPRGRPRKTHKGS